MLDLSTTATFDKLFTALPKPIQRKAAAKTDLFRANPFHPSLHTAKNCAPSIMKSGASASIEPIVSSSRSSALTMSNCATSVIITSSMITICSGMITICSGKPLEQVVVGGRHRNRLFRPRLRFPFGRFTLFLMDEKISLPEFLVRLPEGVIRVAGTRVSLDSVVLAFQDGATPEEICLDFPSLDLAKVYSVLAHYLTHREIIDTYLVTQHRFVEATRREREAHQSPFLAELRRRVAARRALPPACA